MALSNIPWTHYVFNPWYGCSVVSEGCKHCYACAQACRFPSLGKWGPNGERRIKAESGWQEPLAWNRRAKKEGVRYRVFCASNADVFEGYYEMPAADREAVALARLRLWHLVQSTPHLDWLFLTKRPQYVREMVPGPWRSQFPDNVWMGVTMENTRRRDERMPYLKDINAAVHFISAEPLLGQMFLHHELSDYWRRSAKPWVIVGGESGNGSSDYREMDIEAARNLIHDCRELEIPVWVKQDSGPKSDQQGRFTDAEFALKQLPR